MRLPQTIKLKNGLIVVLLQKPDSYSVSLCVVLNAGSKYETSETIGAAHFLEHMLFEGTDKYPDSSTLGWLLESIGGRSTAWTDKDYVQYSVKLPKDKWKVGLEYLSQVLFHSKFSSEMVKNERKIIAEEYKRKIDNSEIEAWELFMAETFGSRSYLGRSILGNPNAINMLTKSKLEDYLRHYYTPYNMVLVLVGKFDLEETLDKVSHYFESKDRGNHELIYRADVKTTNKKIFFKHSSNLQNQIVLGFVTGVTLNHKDLPVLKIIRNLLGFGLGSRIVQELVYKLGVAYSTAAWNVSYQETGIFSITCGVSTENVDIAVQAILSEFTKLKENNVTKKELKNAIAQELAEEFYVYENNESAAASFALQQLLEGEIKGIKHKQEELMKVSQDDIRNVARKYFTGRTLKCLIRGKSSQAIKKKIEDKINHFK